MINLLNTWENTSIMFKYNICKIKILTSIDAK